MARRYYLARGEAKLSYLLPFVIGVQTAGVRITNIQARWGLAAITGRTTWPRTLRVPLAIRRQLCADLGWECLWTNCKASALAMYMKYRSDSTAFAHTRMCNEARPAIGGWIAAAKRLQQTSKIPMWQPVAGSSLSASKRSLAHHRRRIILPAIRAALQSAPINPPLPWLWLASLAGDAFPQKAFELWWQLRVLGQPYPPMLCPWCEPRPELTSTHLRTECSTFATACWIRGIQPEEAFLYPSGPAWFQAALLAVHEIQRAADGL